MFKEYKTMAENQLKEITVSFTESLNKSFTVVEGADLFKVLKFKVSYKCIEFLLKEYTKGERLGAHFNMFCSCGIKIRDGLMCVHQIVRHWKEQRPLRVSELHPFWSTLSLEEVDVPGILEVKSKVARRLV